MAGEVGEKEHKKRGQKDFLTQEKRDREILFLLFCGPSTFGTIHFSLFRHAASGKLLHKRAVQRRIKFLLEQNYIKRKQYGSIKHGKRWFLYTIDQRGIAEVCRHYALNPDHVRDVFPATKHLTHEMVLSELIRVCYREVKAGLYTIDHIYDDRQMKRLVRPKKGLYYPDLHITILSRRGSALSFNIELDTGQKGPKYAQDKLTSWETPTLVVAPHQQRLDRLREYVAATGCKNIIGFALANDVGMRGFAGTEWLWHPDGSRRKIDIR